MPHNLSYSIYSVNLWASQYHMIIECKLDLLSYRILGYFRSKIIQILNFHVKLIFVRGNPLPYTLSLLIRMCLHFVFLIFICVMTYRKRTMTEITKNTVLQNSVNLLSAFYLSIHMHSIWPQVCKWLYIHSNVILTVVAYT